MDLDSLKAAELSQLLNCSGTTLYNWSRETPPIPSFVPLKGPNEKAPTKRYKWLEVLEWYIQRRVSKVTDGLTSAQEQSESAEALKLEKLRIAVQLDEIELLAKRGDYLPADQVESLWVKAVANSRSKLLLVPDTAAKRIYPEMSLADRTAVIEDCVHSALHDMSTLSIDDLGTEDE